MTDTNSKAQVTDWPVGEAEVVIYDPRADIIHNREPRKIIDASLHFMDISEVGDRLYSKAQVEGIVSAALAAQEKPEPGVAVKALEWIEDEGVDEGGGKYPRYRTKFPFIYTIVKYGSRFHCHHPVQGFSHDLAIAKAMVQAHHDNVIRSAIVSTQARAREPTPDMIDEAAKLIAKWLGYSWDGLRERDISDEFPDWATNGVGTLSMQGGKPALRKLAAKILAVAPSPAQAIPDGWKLVPVEPTAEMLEVYRSNVKPRPFYRTAARVVREIIANAPSSIDKGEVK